MYRPSRVPNGHCLDSYGHLQEYPHNYYQEFPRPEFLCRDIPSQEFSRQYNNIPEVNRCRHDLEQNCSCNVNNRTSDDSHKICKNINSYLMGFFNFFLLTIYIVFIIFVLALTIGSSR